MTRLTDRHDRLTAEALRAGWIEERKGSVGRFELYANATVGDYTVAWRPDGGSTRFYDFTRLDAARRAFDRLVAGEEPK